MDGGSVYSSLPRCAGDISAAWLSSALGGGDVAGVSVESLGSSEGFTGQVVRLALAGSGGIPATVIAKFPNADDGRKALFHRLAYAQRELAFYTVVAPSSGLRVPHLYFGAVDAASGDSLLLLEDLGAERCLGSLQSECSLHDAMSAVAAIAGFHAAYWGNTDALEWLPDIRLGAKKTREALAGPWRPVFDDRVRRYAPELVANGAPVAQLLDVLGDRLAEVRDAMAQPPTTVVHSDFRADNIFRMPDGGVAVIDWENIVRARGAVDLGVFAMASLSVQSRRTHESALLSIYVNAVEAGGVDDYGQPECLRDYRLGIANALVVMVLGVVVLDTLTQRDPRWTIEMLKRGEAATVDHGLVAWLRDGEFHHV